MRRVTREEFFGPIFADRLDVHPSIEPGQYPYTSIWRFLRKPGSRPYGKTVQCVEGGSTAVDYYLWGADDR